MPAQLPSRRVLEERAGSGDVDARFMLRVLACLETLPGRVASALEQERVSVVLADGTSMSLDEAERVLAAKEERCAHRSLRASIDDALTSICYISNNQSEFFPPTHRDVLHAFLVDTKMLRDAARDTLAVLGGEPLDDAASLVRSLDLPDEQGLFGEEQTRELIAAARDAARPPVEVARFRAPRALAGVALDATVGASRPRGGLMFAWPPALRRFERHRRTVDAGCTALAWAHGSEAGRAVALELASAPCRRAIGTGRSQAERAGRIGAASAVLRARAAVALASVDPDGARDALADALGVDPGQPLLSELAAPPWVHVDGAVDSTSWRIAAVHALALRDAFDETWPLRTEAWHQLAARDNDSCAVDAAATAAKAWLQWAGDWL